MDHFIQIEQMNEYNCFKPDLNNPVFTSDLYSDFNDSFFIDNFNHELFDSFLNESITCTNNNVGHNNSNQTLDKQQLVINQNGLDISSQENFNIFDDELNSIVSNLHPLLTTTSTITATTSTLATPLNTFVSPITPLTTLMQIPTDQFYTSDVNDLSVIIDDITDDSNRSQSDSFSSNASPNDQAMSVDNYSLSSSSLNSPSSETSDECKIKYRKTTMGKKRKNKIEDAKLTERQLRKREQNRQAAIRYRLKKKKEAENIENEEKQLMDDLKNLQNEIHKMQQSSECYENLLEEILKTYD